MFFINTKLSEGFAILIILLENQPYDDPYLYNKEHPILVQSVHLIHTNDILISQICEIKISFVSLQHNNFQL